MRINLPARHQQPLNLTPLIDVVFILLVFFMLTSRLTQPDPFEVEPPLSASTNPVEQQEFMVLIAADGRLAFQNQEVDEDELGRLISTRLSGPGQFQLKLKADARLEAARLMTVMEVLQRAGVERLILLTALDAERPKG